MNRVTGRILLHETGAGISDLVVTAYDVERDTLPAGGSPRGPVARMVAHWEKLRGDRLGSVLTGKSGEFLLEYDDRELKVGRPDLLLFVTAPERPGAEVCSPLLHVSCGIRQNAGRLESYLIRLGAAELEKAGVAVPRPAAPREVRPGSLRERKARGEAVRRSLEKVRAAWRKDEPPSPRISDLYRQRTQGLRAAGGVDRPPENGFRLALPLAGGGSEEWASLGFDRETGRWFVQRDGERAEIRFRGAVRAAELPSDEWPGAGVSVVLDEENGEFRVVVASAPARLREAEGGPGELFMSRLRQRRPPAGGGA